MYTCSYDDELADIVKAAAKRENRTYRGQFNHYLKLILQYEGLLENPDNKKAQTFDGQGLIDVITMRSNYV